MHVTGERYFVVVVVVVVLAVLVLRLDKEGRVRGTSCVGKEGHWDEKNVGSNKVGPLLR